MALELEGRIKYIGPIQTGQGARGEWKKRIFVINTMEQFPKDIAFVTWNDKAEALDNLRVGQRVVVNFSVESRQHPQDPTRWFTDARAWKIRVIREEDVTSSAPSQSYSQPAASPAASTPSYAASTQTTNEDPFTEDLDDDDDSEDLLGDEYSDLDDTGSEDDLFESEEQDDDLPF